MIDLINKLIEEINYDSQNNKSLDLNDSKIIINNKDYTSNSINKNNFEEIKEKKPDIKIAFIDGGNQNIFKDDMQSIDLIKINSSIFENKKRIKTITNTFILISKAIEINNKILFKLKILNQNKIEEFTELIINPKDEEFKLDKFDLKLEDMPNIIRRIFEIKEIKNLINENYISRNEIICLDGSLKTDNKLEIEELNKYLLLSKEKNISVISILKTSQNYTNKKISVKSLLELISPFETFTCKNIINNNNPRHPAKITFSKLHTLSKLVLRIEFANYIEDEKINTISKYLSYFSKDPTILGYPYGLISADNFARVSNSEIEHIRSIYHHKTKKETSNIHKKLDKISF